MFPRITKRKNADGSAVAYMQVVHNYRTPGEKYCRSKVLFSLGRIDRDGGAMRALANGILRHLDGDDVRGLIAEARDGEASIRIEASGDGPVVADDFRSVKVGIQLLLWALWKKVGLHKFFVDLSAERGEGDSKRAFLIVLNRALDPRSKNALPGWAEREIWCDNANELTADDFYGVLDIVAEHDEALQRQCFEATCALTGDDAKTVCYDTTSSYFEMMENDEAIAEREAAWVAWDDAGGVGPPPDVRRPQVVNDPPLRMRGYSRDHRPELPQTVIGLATTERGLPMRTWVFPGNTTDAKTVIDIQQDLAESGIRDTVFVGDRGMTSAQNMDFLESENVRFIFGKKLRDGDTAVVQALSTEGPMQQIAEGREFLVVVDPKHAGRRLVVVRNPARAKRDAKIRAALVEEATERAAAVNASKSAHPRGACKIETTPGLSRLLKRDTAGKLQLDAAALEREARLDGITILETDTSWAPERISAAYQSLLQTENGWRTMKSTESLRPVHHRRADRIRAHITLCTVALGLIRTAEHLTSRTWRQVVDELASVHRISFEAGGQTHVTTSALTDAQREIFAGVGAESPAKSVHRGWSV